MQFTVSCEAFSRMAEIGRYPVEDLESTFKSLYFERRNNQLFMVACNRLILAVEHLGFNEGPDEFACVDVTNDHLIKQCDDATPYNGMLEIISDNMLRWTSIKTNMGWSSPNSYIHLEKNDKLHTWRSLFPDEMPKKTSGAMRWHTGVIATMATASPSGVLNFPEFIDTKIPVVVNDANTDKWVALFLALPGDDTNTVPAVIPDWIS